MPNIKDNVKIVFNNGTLIEGSVLEWCNNQCKILTHRNDVIEIFNIDNNVLFTKVEGQKLDREIKTDISQGLIEEPVEQQQVFEEDPRLRAATIAELKIEKTKQLREEVSRRLRLKKKPTKKNSYYESPNFTKPGPI